MKTTATATATPRKKRFLGGVLQKAFLEITQNSQKNICAKVSLKASMPSGLQSY